MKPLGSILRQGVIVGSIGYVTIVLFFATLNLIAGRPFYFTAEVLGTALFGLAGAGAIIAANGLHIVFTIVLATIATTAVWVVERQPVAWYIAYFTLLMAVVVGTVFLGLVASQYAVATTWPGIAAANVLATITMGATLWWMHPRLRAIMHAAPE